MAETKEQNETYYCITVMEEAPTAPAPAETDAVEKLHGAEPTTTKCATCRHGAACLDEPCSSCNGHESYEPEPQPVATTPPAADPTIDAGTDSKFNCMPDMDEPLPADPTDVLGTFCALPKPIADPDAPDLCDSCHNNNACSPACNRCDGRSRYIPRSVVPDELDPDSTGAVGDVEQQTAPKLTVHDIWPAAQPEPKRSVYDIARDAIYEIERQAVQLGIAAEWIEIKVDTVRKSAEVRDEKLCGTKFDLQNPNKVGEK